MSNREAGKGCKPRPYSVDQDTYDNNWDRIFGKQSKKVEQKPEDFELESLDPDERSWYYDDDGTKRKKEKTQD